MPPHSVRHHSFFLHREERRVEGSLSLLVRLPRERKPKRDGHVGHRHDDLGLPSDRQIRHAVDSVVNRDRTRGEVEGHRHVGVIGHDGHSTAEGSKIFPLVRLRFDVLPQQIVEHTGETVLRRIRCQFDFCHTGPYPPPAASSQA